MAKKLWPVQDPIGKRFSKKGPEGPFLQVVGLAKQSRYQDPVNDTVLAYYLPHAQEFTTFATFQLRTAGRPEGLISEVEQQVNALAPGMPLTDVQSMEEALNGVNGFFLYHVGTRFAVSLGLIGLALAVIGVYGVISYVATQRTHEIGIRMALGAARRDILAMVLKQGAVLVGAGVVSGLALTMVTARGLSSLLVGVSPTDPLTLIAVSLLLAAVGLLASFIPARRAMKVEPLRALKHE